jgi:UDP-glucose 6-dehydrogenase
VLVIGKGVIGDATGYALEQRGYEVTYHDPPNGIEGSPAGCSIVLLCVPTPMGALGYNSRSILYRCADWLEQQGHRGLVGIRSTVVPGTCDQMQAEFPTMTWFSWPEFLQAARAREMAANAPYVVIGYLGLPVPAHEPIVALLPDAKMTMHTFPQAAEFAKYATNALLAATVGVANELAEYAKLLSIDYNVMVPPICEMDSVLPSNVKQSPEGGFGGACLPKDLAALLFHASRDHGVTMPVLAAVDAENRKRRPECYVGGGAQ